MNVLRMNWNYRSDFGDMVERIIKKIFCNRNPDWLKFAI